ncbi:PAS domain-containing sensor histidine kinase [Candidatus Magnetominusculus xianensis]|uniref:Sensor histidine kinase n=1 Tax=Candidatus Magnetominusculus xianensis TaxID=1748249 RepID=A0ABR5SFR6_9BACT|nr:PAS domain S-box protein [Candidatus Magnetominusculus xianensis]KWT78335.1 putative sensor histidine kinase [Candidatus Magnetominusculus xianensis]MBF0402873.1 PAS domain S-box protein [Nitrospirota bacterium]
MTIDKQEAFPNIPVISEPTIALFKTISGIAAALVFALGVFVLAAWLFNIRDLEILYLNPIAMKANAALMFVLTGVSLWLLQTKRVNRRTRFFSKTCASIAALIGSLTLVEYLFNIDLGIDQALFRDIPNVLMTPHAGRMSPLTAVNFVLAGTALLLTDVETRKGYRLSQIIAIVWGIISMICFMGYLYNITLLYQQSSFTVMAIHTSLAFTLLSIGVVFARPEEGIMIFFIQDGLGSIMARRILAVVTLTPVITDVIIISGLRAGFYDIPYTMAFHTVIITVVIVIIVLHTALTLNKIDYKQRKSEAETEIVARFPGENPFPVMRVSRGLNVTYVNKSSKPLIDYLGFQKDGDNLYAGKMWADEIAAVLDSGQMRIIEIPVNDRVFQFTIAPMPDSDYVNLYGSDITRLKLMEELLNYEKRKLQNILDSMQDGIYIVNQEYTIEYANPVVIREFGSCNDMKCYSYFHGRMEPCPWCRNPEVYQGVTVRWEFTMTNTGKTYDIIDTPLINQDGSISKLEIFRDITVRKQIENDLRLLSRAIEDSMDDVHIVDMSGKILYANKAAIAMTGYSLEESVGMDVANLANDPAFGRDVIIASVKKEGFWNGEILCKKKDGTLYTAWLIVNLVNDTTGKPVALIGTMRDITMKKAIEEAYHTSEANMRALMNSITESVALIGTDGIFITVNDTFARRFKKESSDIVGAKMVDLLTPDVLESRKKYFDGVISTGSPVHFEDIRGETYFYSNMYPVFNENNKVSGVAVYAVDITEHKKYENYLLRSIREKDMLTREVHHRVKNNLQIVAGLIGLQLNYVTDETYKSMFTETMNRIKSISLVHDKLYRSKGLSEVDLKEYIVNLSKELLNSFCVDSSSVEMTLDIEPVVVGVDIAVPCGLIINELFTNILKYAFPDKRTGKIDISIHYKGGDNFEMVISDNGVGFPADVDFRNTKSLGLHIVNLLVRQIGGTIELDKTYGSKFTINFENHKEQYG